jgi:predicted RNA-binding protein with EMAP domain
MSRQQDAQLSEQEGRITLALSAFQSHQFKSLQQAAQAFNVPCTTLSARHRGRLFIDNRRNAQHKLTRTEEQTIIQYILDLDLRGFAPRLCKVADMADKLLGIRDSEPVGKHWAERFVTRSDELKMAFNRAKDRQRILQEDPEIIGAWFMLVGETKAKYGVHNEDIHNFDETGFQMGVIGSMKVVTGSERRS